MLDWLVAADDRTGALEVGAELAAVVGPVVVSVREASATSGIVDLCARATTPDRAAHRAAGLPPAGWCAHKIDSTLRGNWAHELRARHAATGLRVLVVPAWPAMGRTCAGGVVHVHGEPVASVLDDLPEASLLVDADALEHWLLAGSAIGVIDIADTDGLLAMARQVQGHRLLIAGPAGPIGAAFAATFGPPSQQVPPPRLLPALVVCGSASSVAREQIALLRAERPDVAVIAAPDTAGALHSEVALALAAEARGRLLGLATLVIVGGETAAAVLGDAPRQVGGTVLPGLPWSLDEHGEGPLVITKAGGFGGPRTLVDLFGRETV